MVPCLEKRLLLQVLLIVLTFKSSHQRGDGAPAGACIDQTPQHSGVAFQSSTPPYTIKVDTSQVKQNGTLKVSIDGQAPVGGFILQARKVQNEDEILGQFTKVTNEDEERIFSCRGVNDTVTHSSPVDKYGLVFEWKAPGDYLGGVFFRATVAQNYAVFWKNIESSIIEVVTPSTVITTSTLRPTGETRITRGPPDLPTVKPVEKVEFDPIYRGCAETKLCFGVPSGCVAKGSCVSVVSVFVASDRYTFEVQGINNPKYVAAGLSNDVHMGNDSAMECVQNNGAVKLYSSWTYPKAAPYVTRKDIPQSILTLESGTYSDGKLYCRFTREPLTNIMGQNFDLINGKYHLMVVSGKQIEDEKVKYHDITFDRTPQPLALAVVGAVEGSDRLLTKIHGALMVVAWLFTASVGMMMARYFRQTWVGKQFGGKDIWFVWHRLLMFLTVLITVAAFIVILVEVGGYTTTGDNPHAITGLVTVILALIQPIGAFFRPHPGASKRPLFNWGHWFLGNGAHILAIATIFLAVYLPKAQLPSWTLYILVAYVVVYVITHLLLTFGRFRRSMLGIYTTFAALFVVVMICLVVLAPIEDAYSNVSNAFSTAMGSK